MDTYGYLWYMMASPPYHPHMSSNHSPGAEQRPGSSRLPPHLGRGQRPGARAAPGAAPGRFVPRGRPFEVAGGAAELPGAHVARQKKTSCFFSHP